MDENGEILLLHASKNNTCPLILSCALYTLHTPFPPRQFNLRGRIYVPKYLSLSQTLSRFMDDKFGRYEE